MKRLNLFTGNRMENLAAALADRLRRPQADPLAPEIVVVQSLGMERWLSMALARYHGICANMAFPFPNTFVYADIFRAVLPDLPENSPFDRPVMMWKIMEILPGCLEDPDFTPLKHYLEGGDTALKLYQVALRIADLFDQYLTFRPDWILAWEEEHQGGWQPSLWRRISQGHRFRHRAAMGKNIAELLADAPLVASALPERISVFGISTLPPFHLRVLDAVSRYREVNLFVMNPCAEYWGDTLSRRERRKVVANGKKRAISEADLHIGGQNSLLASMGIPGRDFFDMIHEFDPETVDEMYEDPGRETLLACVQSDILNRTERPSDDAPRTAVLPQDRSITFHACHSPMRETEVLFDHLLSLFDEDDTLGPDDILIMAPDIETYAPYIQAVFDRPPGDPKRIPFSIADRGIRSQSRLVEVFLGMLDLDDGRMGASQVSAILETPWIHRKFGLDEADVDLIRQWIADVRIRWGIDGENRAKLGLPPFDEHTWRAGLDRLLLGYAMAGHDERTFAGILPYDAMEGSETVVLGGFLEFTDRLFAYAKDLPSPKSPAEWTAFLNDAVDAFFAIDTDAEKDVQLIGNALADLNDTATRATFDGRVDIRVIRAYLAARLEDDILGFGFITGGVTFCAMLPMRSIPFRFIGLLGMNSSDYPRNTPASGFDLMAAHPRPGDRSRRKDDRYLFLETLLSAREKLYISYVGQSIEDNTAMPPSVLVSELMDILEAGFIFDGSGRAQDRLVTRHRLQAFSPAYFALPNPPATSTEPLFSYAEEHLAAARCLVSPRTIPPPFISTGLVQPDGLWNIVELEQLCRFFGNPHKYLLNNRLGVYLDERSLIVEEKEPFDISGLDRYLLAGNLVEQRLSGHPPAALFSLKKSAGLLPHGHAGEAWYEKLAADVEIFVEKISDLVETPAGEPVDIDLVIDTFTLTGRIAELHAERRVQYRCAKVKAEDHLNAWIRHLALNLADGSHPRRTVVAATDGIWEIMPVEDPQAHLARLLVFYGEGLQRPMPFFPRSSLAFAEQRLVKKNSTAEAETAARKQWISWIGNGEGDDPYYQRCIGENDPFDELFQQTAIDIFQPMLVHRRKIG